MTATETSVDAAVAAHRRAHPGATFEEALSAVFREQPELYRRHRRNSLSPKARQ